MSDTDIQLLQQCRSSAIAQLASLEAQLCLNYSKSGLGGSETVALLDAKKQLLESIDTYNARINAMTPFDYVQVLS